MRYLSRCDFPAPFIGSYAPCSAIALGYALLARRATCLYRFALLRWRGAGDFSRSIRATFCHASRMGRLEGLIAQRATPTPPHTYHPTA